MIIMSLKWVASFNILVVRKTFRLWCSWDHHNEIFLSEFLFWVCWRWLYFLLNCSSIVFRCSYESRILVSQHVPGNCVLLWGAKLGEHPSAALLQGAAWKGYKSFKVRSSSCLFPMATCCFSWDLVKEQRSLRLPQSKLEVLIKSSKLQSCCLFWFPWSNTMTIKQYHDHPWPSMTIIWRWFVGVLKTIPWPSMTIHHFWPCQDRFPANYMCLGIDCKSQGKASPHFYSVVLFYHWFTCPFSEYFVDN